MKKIKIILTPADFIGNCYSDIHDCPLARAVKRHFKTTDASVDSETVTINRLTQWQDFKILKEFNYEDYFYVKEQYRKDPEMKKTCYVVTLEKA